MQLHFASQGLMSQKKAVDKNCLYTNICFTTWGFKYGLNIIWFNLNNLKKKKTLINFSNVTLKTG